MPDFDRQLSPHFTLREMVYSETAQRRPDLREQQENPPESVVANLAHLCTMTLEPLRSGLGGVPIGVTSGYRCPDLNALVGGMPSSQHRVGQAADCHLPSTYPWSPYYAHTVSRDWVLTQTRERTGRYPRAGVTANFYLFAWVCLHLDALDVDQVIHEYGAPGAPAWVHISASIPINTGRREILRIFASDGLTMTKRLDIETALRLGT